MLELNLQMFGEGGGDGGAGGSSGAGAAPSGQAQTGVSEADAALQGYRQYKKTGKMPAQLTRQPAQERPASAEEAPTRDYAQEFDQLISNEYKDVYGKKVQSVIQERFKNRTAAEEKMAKLQPVLEVLQKQYQVEDGDVDGLLKKLTDDDSLYEEEALQRGVPVDVLKQMKTTELQLKQLQSQAEYRQQAERQAALDTQLDHEQAEMRKIYPSFDIRKEIYGEHQKQYQALLGTGMMSVRAAYEFINKDRLEPERASAIAQKTAENLSRSIQAGSNRPVENGVRAGVGQATLSDDPRTWSKERLAQAKRDAYAGKRVII